MQHSLYCLFSFSLDNLLSLITTITNLSLRERKVKNKVDFSRNGRIENKYTEIVCESKFDSFFAKLPVHLPQVLIDCLKIMALETILTIC